RLGPCGVGAAMSGPRHRLFVPPPQLASSAVTLTREQARYVKTVLRLEQGAEIEVFDGEGGLYLARLGAEGRLHVGARMAQEAHALDVVLAQALAKGEKFDLVVQKATE